MTLAGVVSASPRIPILILRRLSSVVLRASSFADFSMALSTHFSRFCFSMSLRMVSLICSSQNMKSPRRLHWWIGTRGSGRKAYGSTAEVTFPANVVSVAVSRLPAIQRMVWPVRSSQAFFAEAKP